MPTPLVECVPNFSEGRDKSVIDAIAAAISSVAGACLLDVDPGADTNRTVYTFVGAPEAVAQAAVEAAKKAYELIDMTRHSGAHPRMGALDVCPFVPVSGIDMEGCVELSKKVAARLASELGVPVYLYEASASRPERVSLADIRSGEYEGLKAKLAKPEWKPDFGEAAFVPRWGATVVGAREFLIAYNVNLNTRDKKLAHEVALAVREAGRTTKDEAGNSVKVPGRLKAVRAIGWYIESYRCAQVSINLLDYKATPLHVVYETVKEEAEKRGLLVTGSEVVGLVPCEPVVAAGRHFLAKMGKSEGLPEAELVETAIASMGLASVSPFDPAKKIIEYASKAASPLASMRLSAFVDEVSAESTAPGGGSVAALAGSLGAALAAMVGNLSVGKKGFEDRRDELSALAVEAQGLKASLVAAIDEDTAAFGAIIEAVRLPKSSEAEKTLRETAIQAAYLRAAEVPLATAEASLRALALCGRAAEIGNPASISDSGVGALLAAAGIEGAALNVFANISQLADAEAARKLRDRALELVEEGRAARAGILDQVRASVGF
jgi:glutamate formiminotransferase